MKQAFKKGIYFLLLLPLFFVLNGYTRHFNFVPVGGALLLLIVYAECAFCIAAICRLLFRNMQKAGIAAFFVMAFFFFFGAVKDQLQSFFPGTFLWHYSFLLTAGLVVIVLIAAWLKKTKKPVYRLVYYLNVLFVILILTETGRLAGKMIQLNRSSEFNRTADKSTVCDTCHKPDIFFVVLDEYAGNKELTGRLHFDNTGFENELQHKGFHIVNESISNYNATIFSVASILNMDYLDLKKQDEKGENFNYAYRIIRDSRVVKYLAANGYTFYNNSFFAFIGQPAIRPTSFLPNSTRLITSATLAGRMADDNIINFENGRLRFGRSANQANYSQLYNNRAILQHAVELAGQRSAAPKFVFTHLMMPHLPYYYDNKGNLQPENILISKDPDDKLYIEYLQYCNGFILKMVHDILKKSGDPPVIILLGDHGYRNEQEDSDRNWCFYNLDAMYFPDKDYHLFYDRMSNVNQFRLIFNKLFSQHLPLLKDSTVYIKD